MVCRGHFCYMYKRLISGLPFDDFNLLSGHFENNEQAVLIDQLSPETGPCQLE